MSVDPLEHAYVSGGYRPKLRIIKPNGDATGDHQATDGPEPQITLDVLQHKVIEPIRWIVPDYIPEGLTIFAGRPKIGKSWFMLGVALAKARGTEVLGKFLDKADVLYCGLEDGERRMQTRVAKILGPAIKNWPDNFTFRYHLDPLEDGGVDTLEAWLKGHPAGRLIVIDTLAKVRGIKRANEEQYQYDYRIVGLLQELATKYRIAIVVIHHVRKTEAEDVLDTIAGSTGLGGAADCLQVLSRHEKGTRLYLRGRDAEEQDKLVEFDAETALWEVICNFDEQPGGDLSGLRRLVFECLRGHAPVHLTPAEVAEKIGHPRPNVQRTLNRMAHADPPEARRSPLKRGAYELVK